MIARRLLLPLPALLLARCAGSAESRPGTAASAPALEMNPAGLTQGGFVAGRTVAWSAPMSGRSASASDRT